MNTSLLFLGLEKSGGLFDLDGTLPLVAIQFLGLMLVLNFLLYTPILNLINERNQYINKNLAKASILLAQSKELIKDYETESIKARKEAQQEGSKLQKLHKTILENESKLAQRRMDEFLQSFAMSLQLKKNKVLATLKRDIDLLTSQILSKILA